MCCSIGAIAQYLRLWSCYISGKPVPSFRSRSDWYRLKLLVGEEPTAELAYTTQYGCCLACFQEAGVTRESVTHCMRSGGARLAEALC